MDAPPKAPDENGKVTVPTQLRAETMAYAAQSCIYGLAANVFEPYIGYRFQKHYSAANTKHGSYSQNLLGEIAGDIIGSSTLIAAEAFAPNQLHAMTRQLRRMVDPIYSSAARFVFAKECTDPNYEQKMQQWKVFQERNLIRSGIIASANITGNLATQKFVLGNTSPTSLIFKGKLLSTALSTALGLTVRLAFPTQMRKLDKWLGKEIFVPMLEDASPGNGENPTSLSHVQKLAQHETALSRA